jgi:hypothetical protein
MSPVAGSTTPGVPRTTRRTRSSGTRARRATLTTASCTTCTGSSLPSASSSIRPPMTPVMSAPAAITLRGPTSTPTTYAADGTTA